MYTKYEAKSKAYRNLGDTIYSVLDHAQSADYFDIAATLGIKIDEMISGREGRAGSRSCEIVANVFPLVKFVIADVAGNLLKVQSFKSIKTLIASLCFLLRLSYCKESLSPLRFVCLFFRFA